MSNFIRHLSIRVPWHDTSWEGSVCKNPEKNVYCTILKGIRENKKNDSCKCFDINEGYPPCINEKVSFMQSKTISMFKEYPYTYKEEANHFKPTEHIITPYSVATVPFRWMLKNMYEYIEQENGFSLYLDSDNYFENKFSKTWWQAKDNQEKLFNKFYSFIKSNKSMCFFYSKNAPFIENTNGRRIIIGIGLIESVDKNKEYEYSKDEENMHRAFIWEHNIDHSIRSDSYKKAILLPYHKLYEYSLKNPDNNIDWNKCTLLSPENALERFSYSTEHVFHENAIEVLMSAKNVLKEINKHLKDEDFREAYKWIEEELSSLWELRGPYPSFGEVLVASGIENGFDIEKSILESGTIEDIWDYFENNINDFTSEKTKVKSFMRNKDFYYLLSRLSLPLPEIKRLKMIEDHRLIVENPYTLYLNHNIDLFTIDRAFYPNKKLKELFTNVKHNYFEEVYDERRIEALLVYVLRKQVYIGHTIFPLVKCEKLLEKLPIENIEITQEDIKTILEDRKEFICEVNLKDKTLALQLNNYKKIKIIIEDLVTDRIKKRNSDTGKISTKDEKLDDNQKKALEKLYKNRFSVLAGAAGTGKTRVIKAFCEDKNVQNKGILCLAPTGKARTLLQTIKNENIRVDTIAGFLLRYNRYNDMQYCILEKKEANLDQKTLIIDECSMLTEDMLAALFEVADSADRIILVGDDNQIPPIGAGKPFADIIDFLTENKNQQNLINLYENHRQKQGASIDFALNFTKDGRDKEYFLEDGDDLKFIQWDDLETLGAKLLEVLEEDFHIHNKNSYLLSIGGTQNGEYVNLKFDKKSTPQKWQILSPARQNSSYGTKVLNNLIHNKLFETELKYTYYDKYKNRKMTTPQPRGEENILFGAKVINIMNTKKQKGFKYQSKEFIANGEIGIVKGFLDKTKSKDNDYLQVDFENIEDGLIKYDYTDFQEEKNPIIELAYSLTVHKSQGSQFYETLVILPKDCGFFMNRELIYTALTRHENKIIVLHQGDKVDLREYTHSRYSNLAKRMTNLLRKNPDIEYINKYEDYFDMNRIHKTINGEFVRSKSEVIIANLLYSNNIPYLYEKKLILGETEKIPDFSIDRSDIGIKYYWEHLGMLNDEHYAKKWEKKKSWYNENGIFTFEENPDSDKILIITDEGIDTKGFDSEKVQQIIDDILLN